MQQTPGKLFLAEERGLTESDRFRRHSTFSFGPFAHPHKGPFGRLYGLNDETLAGGHALEFTLAEASHVLLLPLTGAVALAPAGQPETTLEVEEMLVLPLPAGSVLSVRNPYATEQVRFLHIWLRATPLPATGPAQRTRFRFDDLRNQLLALGPAAAAGPVAASLGRFEGRHEARYRLQAPGRSAFVYVLAGAFEAEGRLLHENDGLALWHTPEFELEALSNHALVLVLDLAP